MTSENISPVAINVAITLADTQYSQALPAGCKHFSFKLRDATKTLRWAVSANKVQPAADPYLTLAAGQSYPSPEKLSLKQGSETLYFACPDAGQVVEIIAWVPA